MRLKANTQIPNGLVYAALYAILFAVCIWLLVFHPENPTNWLAYAAIIVSVLAGAIKLAVHSRKPQRTG